MHEDDFKKEGQKFNRNIYELDSVKLGKFLEEPGAFRFLRSGNSIYISSLSYEHKDIIRTLGLDPKTMSDGGFLTIANGNVTLMEASGYLNSQGVSDIQQLKNRPDTVDVFQSQVDEIGADFIVKQ